MRKLFLLFILLGQPAFAQPESLVRDTKRLYEAFDLIDIDVLSDLICTADPTQIAAALDSWFQNDETKFRFVRTNAKYTYEKVPGTDHYTVKFRNVVRITYFKKIDANHELEILKKQFAAQSITYDAARNAYLITYQAKMYALAHQGSWKFAFADSTLPIGLSNGCIGPHITNP